MTISTSQEILAAQIQALYRHTPMVLTVNIINSGVVAAVLASYLKQTRWWIFFGLVAALTAARGIGWVYYRSHRKAADLVTRWAIIATAGSGLSGLLWGGSNIFLLSDDIVGRTFLAFTIGGMCAGALFSLSYYLPAFMSYTYFSLLPLSGTLLLDGRSVYLAMGCMTMVFAAALTFAAHHFNRAFMRGLCLNLDLTERTKELTQRTDELITVNSRLEAEIAQREAAENRLHQAQKMEALGQLTGGMAHDFNNLLTAIIGNLELAQKRAGGDPNFTRPLDAALSAAERGATLIQDLLTFARRKPLHPRAVDISGAMANVEKILKQTIGPAIRMKIGAPPDVRPAWVDPNQLELALLNLALNARDAMPDGGQLTMTCENGRADASDPVEELAPGDYVTVSVSDSGIGMSEETLAHACEPFFTTKETSRGSGMGLAMVQGFVTQSGGVVQIFSSLGKGTTVQLWLPPAEGRPTAANLVEAREHDVERRLAHILVCDDDGDVRSFVAALLSDLGHTVWEANNPTLALEILARERPVDLLLVDYAIPEMNGRVVIDRARAIQPKIRTLLMTGATEALRNESMSGIPILSKPFRVTELNSRIAEILSAGDNSRGGNALP
jgi:signal transduction histidine kinase